MGWIRTIPPEEATGRLQKIYEAARQRAGRVFNIVRVMSLKPRVLEASLDLYRHVMFGRSQLSRRQRELLAVIVSRANDCHY
jgi:alkylhydroperoxidase family enzyme